MMSNSKLYSISPNESIIVPVRETVESDENGYFYSSQVPCGTFYVYDAATGAKVIY